MKDLSPFIPVFYSSVVGAAALFVPAYFEGMMRDWVHYATADWFGIFYLGFFGTVLGFVWYYQGIKMIGPMKAGQFINFVPISAVLLSFFILGEPITLSLLVGAIFVISGVYLTNT
jgi:drug/metabolite transporter (DMT)-like permease